MSKELINIGKKSKKAFSFHINSKKKNKVLIDYCTLIKKNEKLIINQNRKDVYAAKKRGFKKNLIDGNISNFKNESIIIGKYLAIELGVVVGDKINIMSSNSMSTPLGNIPKQLSFEIAAVFSSGLYEFDRSVSFFNLIEILS